MRAPEFWVRRGVLSAIFSPAACAYDLAGRARGALARPYHASVPVVCVGNLTAGGAGKTPVALAVAARLGAAGREVHFLSRGYGGHETGPLRVAPGRHGFREVGDEALLLARRAPTWVARDRVKGARAAVEAGAQTIVMDDGFQNPSLAKDISLLVVDGAYGFGNGRVMPAGPLREPIGRGLGRAAAVVLVGAGTAELAARLAHGPPVLRARLVSTDDARALAGRKVVAFAGIGRPEKFFATLREIGCDVVESIAFPDHHPFKARDLDLVLALARERGARPVTTEKDAVRLPPEIGAEVATVAVEIAWEDAAALDRILRPAPDGQ